MDWTLLLLGVAGFVAGFVDAAVGGGGLIQLPALVIAFPHAAPLQLLATNKLASFMGTSMSSVTYLRRVKPDVHTLVPLMVLAFAGSLAGAGAASLLNREQFEPIILALLVLVGAWVLFKPKLGEGTTLKHPKHRHLVLAGLTGLVIGFYDGALGPGTGSFFTFALVGLLGYSFLDASAKSRLANWGTNLAALVIFIPQNAVMWNVGLVVGLANLAGAYVGARVAVAKGSGFVRVLFLVIVAAFVIKIGSDLVFG
ncbi:MAG TPA: TSUP family transporter [Candidatus Lumbricidophila sp.]|nr:TSUP family transporter [Candidatus Lumbricidophila sp.]